MNMLGNTLEKIAFEKAGIIKTGIPVVIGESIPESRPVFEKAANESPISFAQEKRYVVGWNYEHHSLIVEIANKSTNEHQHFQLDLPGIYQTKNLLTVLESIHQLKENGFNINEHSVKQGLANVKKLTGLHGRWEKIHDNPTVILDVGHNQDGIAQIKEQLEFTNYDHLHIIIGMVKDKEIEPVMKLLPSYANYYFTKAQIPRALNEISLQQIGSKFGLNGHHFSDVNAALQNAISKATDKDLILVCGSVFLVGEVTLNP